MSNIFLLLLLVVSAAAFYTSAPGTSTINKARSFQASLNRAIGQRDERGVGRHVSDWMVYDKCQGPDGDKRDFVRTMLSEQKVGVVTNARDDGTLIHYDINYGNKKMEMQIGSKESTALPRLLILAREKECRQG